MPSLFRIDRNSLTADNAKPTSVVQLPGFEDMVEQNKSEEPEAAPVAEPGEEEGEVDPVLLKKQELQQVQQQIDAAKAEAKSIIDEAHEKAKQIEGDAQQKGYDEGFAQAQASVREEQQKDTQLIEQAVLSLSHARQEVFDEIEKSVIDLSLYIAEHIIKIKMDENDEVFLNIVRDTLSKVRYQNNIIVNVSKEEYERLFADPNSEIVQELGNSGVEIKQDLGLKSGECRVETEFGNISAGIKTQLKRLGYALEEGTSG